MLHAAKPVLRKVALRSATGAKPMLAVSRRAVHSSRYALSEKGFVDVQGEVKSAPSANAGPAEEDDNATRIVEDDSMKVAEELFANLNMEGKQAGGAPGSGQQQSNAEAAEDELLPETEQASGSSESHTFQAETRQLLDIVAKSLYTDSEVFIRELISNGSDALEKLRHVQQAGQNEIADADVPLSLAIACDEVNRTFTIQDHGIGMNKEELIANLGTIAHSGSKAFLNKLKEGAGADSADSADAQSSIIGQFGVGFYSAFMVADHVKVYTRSFEPDAVGYCWSSDGSGNYDLSEAEGVTRGTKIILSLKEDCKEFATKDSVNTIIKKYSNFVSFDISLNGGKVNTIEPLWTMAPSEVSSDQLNEFYRYVASDYQDPRFHVHFRTDAPVDIKSLLFIPKHHMERFGMGRMEPGVSLYSRKVLIQAKAGLLPPWLRFVKGVVDCDDIPLNISRESMQDTPLMQKLGRVITSKVINHLDRTARNDEVEYGEFYKDFSPFIKEGICTSYEHKDKLAKLLRFQSSFTEDGKTTSLANYVERMGSEQKNVYYLIAPNRQIAEQSPYLEAFQDRNEEVLFCDAAMDDFVMSNLFTFAEKTLVSVEAKDLKFDGDGTKSVEEKVAEEKAAAESGAGRLSKSESDDLSTWLKQTLAGRVSQVRVSDRLRSSPSIVVDQESASFRRIMKTADFQGRPEQLPPVELEINPGHVVITRLFNAKDSDPKLAKEVAEQLLDNGLIAAGLLDDPRSMLKRLNGLLASALPASDAETMA